MPKPINLDNIVRIDSEYFLNHSRLYLKVYEIDSEPTRYNPKDNDVINNEEEPITRKDFYKLLPHYTFRCTIHEYYFDFPQYENNNKENIAHRNHFKNLMICQILNGEVSPKYTGERQRFNGTPEPVYESTALQKRVYAINRFREEYKWFYPPRKRTIAK